MILNDKNRELYLVWVAMAVTACYALGIDASAVMPVLGPKLLGIDQPTADLLGTLVKAHGGQQGSWPVVVIMWVGITVHGLQRIWLKGKMMDKTDAVP